MAVRGLHDNHIAVVNLIDHFPHEIEVAAPLNLHIAAPEQGAFCFLQRAAQDHMELLPLRLLRRE